MKTNAEREMTMQAPKTKIVSQKGNVDIDKYKYKREDCETGFLTDPREIEEYRKRQSIDIYQNALLGDYANDGEYYLSDEIADELIKCRKVITNNYENYVFAQSIRPIGDYGVAKFFITVQALDEGLIAFLTFVEPVHKMNKLVTNAQSVQLASFADKAGEAFYFDMKEEFNIVDDDFVVPEDEDQFMYSLRKKEQRVAIWRHSVKQIEKSEREIFEKRMQILEKIDNEYSRAVLGEFKNQLKKKEPFFDKGDNKYICYNQLLDDCLNMMMDRFPEQHKEVFVEFYNFTQEAVGTIDKIIDTAKTTVAMEQDKTKVRDSGDNSRKGHSEDKSKDHHKVGPNTDISDFFNRGDAYSINDAHDNIEDKTPKPNDASRRLGGLTDRILDPSRARGPQKDDGGMQR